MREKKYIKYHVFIRITTHAKSINLTSVCVRVRVCANCMGKNIYGNFIVAIAIFNAKASNKFWL